jgi:hypothetical protein
MSKTSFARKRLFVDPEVQGQLVLRVILYWVTCLITVALMVMCWRIVNGPARPFYRHLDDMWFHLGPALLASLLLLPIVVVDVIRVSNRFVGPLLRLRRSLRGLARGEEVEPIRFRQGDFWQGFADEFNSLVTRVKELEIAAYRNTSFEAAPCHHSESPDLKMKDFSSPGGAVVTAFENPLQQTAGDFALQQQLT